jgi:hypothetical protein
MTPSEVRNPFALLMNPEVVIKAMEASERLNHLRSRICRPLDRQQGAGASDHEATEQDADRQEPEAANDATSSGD